MKLIKKHKIINLCDLMCTAKVLTIDIFPEIKENL